MLDKLFLNNIIVCTNTFLKGDFFIMTSKAKKIWEVWGKSGSLYTLWANNNKINSYQLFVFYAIDGYSSITQKLIVEYTGLSKQTVNSVIRTLKKDGYIELDRDPNNLREKLVKLTDKGKEYSSKLLRPLHEIENKVIKLIGSNRIDEMMDTIELFTTMFEKEVKNG